MCPQGPRGRFSLGIDIAEHRRRVWRCRGNGVIQRIEQVGRGIHKRSVKVKGDDVC